MMNAKDYKDMSIEEKTRRLEQSRNDSVKSRNNDIIDINYKNDRYKISASRLKKAVVTLFLATSIAATGVGVGLTLGIDHAIESVREDEKITQVLSSYDEIVTEETHRTNDGSGYWYDTRAIGVRVLESDDKDLALYGVFNRMVCDTKEIKERHMDEVISTMSTFAKSDPSKYDGVPTYTGFSDYLIQNGCVDKDGNPSVEVYREKMDQYALATSIMKSATSEFDSGNIGAKK